MKKLRNMMTLATGMLAFSFVFVGNIQAQDDAPELTDPEIASVAVTANQIDIDYADIALETSKNAEVRRFAETMKSDHAAVIEMAVELAQKLGVTPKDNAVTQSLLDGQKETTKKLKALKGKKFDRAYIDNEVAYHEAVIGAVETVLIPQTENAELKELLVKVLPSLKVHLKHAKMVQKEYK